MGKTRIRWRNVARLGAGAIVAALLVALTGAMLKPKAPQPLPADVGLDGIRGQAVAYTPPEHPPRRDARPARPQPAQEHPLPPPAHHRKHAAPARQPVSEPLAPAPPAAAPPPVSAPEPPANEPPVQQPQPEPPPQQAPAPPPKSHSPSQFGFEQ
jgi:hypothetical protein